MADEQLDYGDDEFGGSQKMQYHNDGAIPALADDEIGNEDDDYDDLYNDVNVGEGFLQMQRSENVGNGGFHEQKVNVQETRPEPIMSQDVNIPTKKRLTVDLLQKKTVPQVNNDMGFLGSIPVPQKPPLEPVEPVPVLNSNPGGISQMPGNQNMNMNVNMNMTRPIGNDNQIRPLAENGATTLFVGELHWWTTDAELENVLSQYGRVKEIKFFDERASGKSKGYCQVEFFESGSAAACKDGMNGYVFNGRPCVVAFASPQTIRQMGASYGNKNQQPGQSQGESQGRRPMNDMAAGRGGGNGGNNFSGGGHMRGRGVMGPKNVNNNPGFGNMPAGGGYGQGVGGPGGPGFGPPGGFMHPQGMMGGGFDPNYMGRGVGYGGFPGSGFPGMMPQFPSVNSMGLPGVAPHVNPAFFNRGMGAGGMGMMSGMEGPQSGTWGDTGMSGWGGGGEEHGGGQRTRESSYGGEDGGSEYGYGDEKIARSKERASEREWSGNSEKKHRDERDHDRERYDKDKDYKYKEEKDSYRDRDHRQKDRTTGYEDDFDRGQSSTRSRSRSRAVAAVPEEDHRSRSRDVDYGKRRRMRSD